MVPDLVPDEELGPPTDGVVSFGSVCGYPPGRVLIGTGCRIDLP